jgi:hypothetical protein
MNLKKLNIGCYDNFKKGYINLDQKKYFPEIDIAHDLETFPYPFKSNEFKEILALCVLEHISRKNLREVFHEFGRIGTHGCEIKIKVPYGVNWIRDVDHEGGFDFLSFLSLTSASNQDWRVGGKGYHFKIKSMTGIPTIFGKLIPNIPTPFSLKKQNTKFRCGLRDIASLFTNFIYVNMRITLEVIKK